MNQKNSLGLNKCFLDKNDPIDLFEVWMNEARKTEPNDPNAVSKPMGNFPGIEPESTEPQKGSKIKIEKTDENKDPFTTDKKASVYNFRKSIN